MASLSDSKQSSALIDQRSRIDKIQQLPGNLLCADCSATSPQWASLLLNEEEGSVEGLGVIICENCAVYHLQEVGDDRCFLKFLQYFHEWTTPELDILEHSGNRIVNGVYEAKLEEDERHDPKTTSNPEKQAKFIRHKYKKCKFRDEDMLWHALEAVAVRARKVEAMRTRRNSLEKGSRRSSINMYGSLRRGSMQNSCSLRRGSMLSARRCSVETGGSRTNSENSMDRSAFSTRGMDTSMLSMADSIENSANFSFEIMEDDESFFLACARRTGDGPRIQNETNRNEVLLEKDDAADEKDATTPRRLMPRRISNDPGHVPSMPKEMVQVRRNRMMRKMITLQEETGEASAADPPFQRSMTS